MTKLETSGLLFITTLIGLCIAAFLWLGFTIGLSYNPDPKQADKLMLWWGPAGILLPIALLILSKYLSNIIGKSLLAISAIFGFCLIMIGIWLTITDFGESLAYIPTAIYGALIIKSAIEVRKHWPLEYNS